MTKHAYVAYQLTVTKSRHPDDLLDVGNFDGKGSDLLTLFHGFLQDLSAESLRDEEYERYLSVTEIDPLGRRVNFITEYGRYGVSGTLVDTTNGTATHTFGKAESPLIGTRNLLVSPKKGDWGILLTERYGGRGAASMLLSQFKKSFRRRFDDDRFVFKYDGLMDPAAWAKYVDSADMTELQIKRLSPASDFADPVVAKSIGQVVSHVKPSRGQQRFPREMRDKLLNGQLRAQDLISMPVKDGDEVELTLNDGGQQRSVIVGVAKTPILAYILAPDEHERPTNDEVKEAMLNKVDDLKTQLPFGLAHDWKDGKWSDDMIAVKMEVIREEQ